MEKARCNTELYSNLRVPLNNVKPSNFWGSHHTTGLFLCNYLNPSLRFAQTAPIRGMPTTHFVRVGRHRCFDVLRTSRWRECRGAEAPCYGVLVRRHPFGGVSFLFSTVLPRKHRTLRIYVLLAFNQQLPALTRIRSGRRFYRRTLFNSYIFL